MQLHEVAVVETGKQIAMAITATAVAVAAATPTVTMTVGVILTTHIKTINARSVGS
jgi:hypothetical protein